MHFSFSAAADHWADPFFICIHLPLGDIASPMCVCAQNDEIVPLFFFLRTINENCLSFVHTHKHPVLAVVMALAMAVVQLDICSPSNLITSSSTTD